MAPHDPDRYIVRIDQESYSRVLELVERGCLRPSAERVVGPGGTVFAPVPGTPLEILDDENLTLAGVQLTATVGHLPTPAYIAVVHASPLFRQYGGVDDLLALLRDPYTEPDLFARGLETAVLQGRRPDPVPRLVVPPLTFRAAWRPSGTLLLQTEEGDWFLVLSFSLRHSPVVPVRRSLAVGLDLGRNPMTVGVADDGTCLRYGGGGLSPVSEARLGSEARRLHRLLRYAEGRRTSERLVGHLTRHAHTVFAERLTLGGMSAGFLDDGRAEAVLDHHYSALPQYLYRAGVSFRRVPAEYTSLTCSLHGLRGTRSGRRFRCPHCEEVQDSEVNAARNVLHRGLRMYGAAKRSAA